MAAETLNPIDAMDTIAAMTGDTKLKQDVEISDAGPCRKKVKIRIDREVIDGRFKEKYDEIAKDRSMAIPGFRPGKAPRDFLIKKFKSHVKEEVRREVLMASLQQLAEDSTIAPLAPPDLKADQLELPETGPFVYEFEVEVRPEFTLPDMNGIKIRKPVREFGEADIAEQQKYLLERNGQVVPKDGAVELNDLIVVDMVTFDGDKELNKAPNMKLRVEPKLVLADGAGEEFGNKMVGAKIGDTRTVDIKLAEVVSDQGLKGKVVQGKFTVKEVNRVEIPEMTPELLAGFGVRNEEQLQELIEAGLRRNLEYQQRQTARSQILSFVMDKVKFDLPQNMIVNQARRTLQRKVMEMRGAGFSDEKIGSQIQLLEQNAIQTTAIALMEHFILQKVAEDHKIEIEDSEIDDEIRRIAESRGESFRKLKAQYEREEAIEAVATEILEAKALDIILKNAVYEEYDQKAEESTAQNVASTGAQVVPGEMVAPTVSEPAAE
jgi:trigger factor